MRNSVRKWNLENEIRTKFGWGIIRDQCTCLSLSKQQEMKRTKTHAISVIKNSTATILENDEEAIWNFNIKLELWEQWKYRWDEDVTIAVVIPEKGRKFLTHACGFSSTVVPPLFSSFQPYYSNPDTETSSSSLWTGLMRGRKNNSASERARKWRIRSRRGDLLGTSFALAARGSLFTIMFERRF